MQRAFTKYLQRLFKVLAYFPFTTSETERDYYQRKLNVRVALRVAKQLKTLQNDEILRKSQNWFQV